MTENFKVSDFDRLYKSNTVKLSYSGAKAKNYQLTLNQVFNSGNPIKYVYMSLDDYMLSGKFEFNFSIPSWVYNYTLFDTIQYLYNKNLLFTLNKESVDNPLDEAYNWNDKFVYSKEQCRKDRKYTQQKQTKRKFTSNSKDSIAKNLAPIITYIKQHPEAKFEIFVPPYSMIWNYELWRNNEVDFHMQMKSYVYGELLKYNNVTITFLQDNLEMTSDLDNYRDYVHYSEKTNEQIVKIMYEKSDILTKDNYKYILEKWKNLVENYDYKKLFE